MATANDVLRVARGEIGYSRWNDPQPGTKYGRWYAGLTGDSYYGTSGVPFCAMGVSWVLNQVGQAAPGCPGAYCPWMVTATRNSGQAVDKSAAQPGDIVYFDWENDGVSDHVGFCEINYPGSKTMQTIEFNTNNGSVARRTRYYSNIVCVCRPKWGGSSSAPAPSTPSTSTSGKISEDGWWGPATTRKLQEALGTTADGVISGQDYADFAAVNKGGLQKDTWSIGGGGSDVVYALQKKIGVNADRYFGPVSCKGLQRYLGTIVDGVISGPSDAVKAMQKRLNAGTF